MKDDDGRELHLCLRDPVRFSHLNCRFILPTIGLSDKWRPDNCILKADVHQYMINIAWWKWQWGCVFAEFRDDRTERQVADYWERQKE